MKIDSVTGARIWDAMCAEPRCLHGIPEEAFSTLAAMCDEIAEVINPFIRQLLTPDTHFDTFSFVLHVMITQRWVRKALESYHISRFKPGRKEAALKYLDLVSEQLQFFISPYKNTTERMRNIALEASRNFDPFDPINERYLRSQYGGRLTEETVRLWQRGGFTIGDLITVQPSALVRLKDFIDTPFLRVPIE